MNNLILKIFTALLILAAILVSPGWVKDITGEEKESATKESVQKDSNVKVTGVSLENSQAGIYSLKFATMSYAPYY